MCLLTSCRPMSIGYGQKKSWPPGIELIRDILHVHPTPSQVWLSIPPRLLHSCYGSPEAPKAPRRPAIQKLGKQGTASMVLFRVCLLSISSSVPPIALFSINVTLDPCDVGGHPGPRPCAASTCEPTDENQRGSGKPQRQAHRLRQEKRAFASGKSHCPPEGRAASSHPRDPGPGEWSPERDLAAGLSM